MEKELELKDGKTVGMYLLMYLMLKAQSMEEVYRYIDVLQREKEQIIYDEIYTIELGNMFGLDGLNISINALGQDIIDGIQQAVSNIELIMQELIMQKK